MTNSPVLLLHYPSLPSRGFSYLPRSVKLEFGSLTEQRPVGQHPVRPWLADELPAAFADWQCEVVALDVGRSFWEKATILHAEHHRPADSDLPLRYSRHYADVAALASLAGVRQAIRDGPLRQRVVDWKARFFARGWARYDLAAPPTFRLLPAPSRMAALANDYAAMAPMYFTSPLPFEAVLAALRDLEAVVNAG